jgi:ribonuclease P protein component
LRRRNEINRVFRSGRHNSGRFMAVRTLANEGMVTRYAFSISRRVSKSAVVRNKVRRRLREATRLLPVVEGFDVVIVARPEAALTDFHGLKTELSLLLTRARLLPPA